MGEQNKETIGVPINDFIESAIASYLQGFDNAIECLKAAKDSIDIKKMKETMLEQLRKRSDSDKSEW